MNQLYEKLTPYLEQRRMIQTSLTLFEWDLETMAPDRAVERTATVMELLQDGLRKAILEPETKQTIEALKEAADLTPEEEAVVRELSLELEKMEAIPAEEYRAYANLQAKAASIWSDAKEKNDFSAFAPTLEKVVDMTRRFAEARANGKKKPYDVLLEDYEKGFTEEKLDPFFEKLEEELPPLVQEVVKAQEGLDDFFLHQSYPIGKQREFNEYLADYMGLDKKRVAMAESAHPFTTNLHCDDVRITTHYYEKLPVSAIFSTIHEGGHALYELGVAPELTLTPVGMGASCGMHESQSRFYENMLGRRKEFWIPLYGKLQELFEDQLGEISLDQFMAAVNRVQPGPVRIEADELTYSLHILVRYRLEKELFGGELKVKELPERWEELYEKYLGIRPKDAAEGVLQDIHWAQGSFGYFPSYALGNAFAAQIDRRMEEEIPVGEILAEGRLSEITDWLREKIHRFGAVKPVPELLREATGEDFCPDYYLEYLKNKAHSITSLSKKVK
ncbi:carboxypeptidase M32 [Cuneatibacter sp. NSJ-177]|uniref:carboxypeptidase M32 n=1 Tax=Cuneatibacter sp. NSJ-177 TaxID=2931401 RepID=UPI001FD40E2A|nr:carboxypeptidase M32 [Cuneatibacter sp. NSJ-177]MCJ7835635.1 carboxypeptidase M32 [Cuneatibacter sp. NSJ-177]